MYIFLRNLVWEEIEDGEREKQIDDWISTSTQGPNHPSVRLLLFDAAGIIPFIVAGVEFSKRIVSILARILRPDPVLNSLRIHNFDP